MNNSLLGLPIVLALILKAQLAYSLDYCEASNSRDDSQLHQIDQLVYQSINNNTDLDIAKLNLKIADLSIKKSLATFYPSIDLRSSSINTKKYGQIPGVDTVLLQGNDNINSSVSTLSTTLNIYSGGHSINSYRQAKNRRQFTHLQRLDTKRQLIYKTIELYGEVKEESLKLQYLQAKMEFAHFEKELNQYKAKKGQLSEIQHQKTQIELRILAADIEGQTGLFEDSLSRLSAFAGIQFEQLTDIRNSIAESSDCYHRVFANHAGLERKDSIDRLKLKNEIKDLRYEHKKILSRYKPSIDIVASIDATGYSEDSLRDSFSESEKDKRYYGIQLQWNLFDGFAKGADLQKVKLEIAKKNKQLDRQQTNELLERSKLSSEFSNIQSQIRVLKNKSEIISEEIYLLRAKLSKGLDSELSLKQAELTYADFQLQIKRLEVNLGITQLRLYMLSQH